MLRLGLPRLIQGSVLRSPSSDGRGAEDTALVSGGRRGVPSTPPLSSSPALCTSASITVRYAVDMSSLLARELSTN